MCPAVIAGRKLVWAAPLGHRLRPAVGSYQPTLRHDAHPGGALGEREKIPRGSTYVGGVSAR